MGCRAFSVVSSTEHPGAKRLARSAAYWGWNHSFIIKEAQMDLKPPYNPWRPSFRAEQLGWLDACRKWDGEENLLYVDGWDAVFTGPPQELQVRKNTLTFGGDTVIYPEGMPWQELGPCFPKVGLEEFRYVNAGSAWGSRLIMMELAADYLQNSPEQYVNQAYFNYRYLFELGVERNRLFIDTKAEVALNIMLVQKRFFQMRGNRVNFTATGSFPLIVHTPGQGVSHGPNAVPFPPELEKLYVE